MDGHLSTLRYVFVRRGEKVGDEHFVLSSLFLSHFLSIFPSSILVFFFFFRGGKKVLPELVELQGFLRNGIMGYHSIENRSANDQPFFFLWNTFYLRFLLGYILRGERAGAGEEAIQVGPSSGQGIKRGRKHV